MSKIIKEIRSIKFYLDESIVNKEKRNKIIRFLEECRDVENQVLEYYWDNFEIVTNAKTWITFSYDNFKVKNPNTKSHHYAQIRQQAYNQLKSSQIKIKNKIKFNFNDKQKQTIYNYFARFCFNWDDFEKYIEKQLKIFKIKDRKYYDFLLLIKNTYDDEEQRNEIINAIESEFYKIKNEKFKCPKKKELQIWCNTFHTVEIKKKFFDWWFIIDNNDRIGGSEKKGVYDTIIVPVKFSKYHKNKLKGKRLKNSFNLKLNKYGRIEITGVYEENVKYLESKPKEYLGIDIGLKKLITTSDGEFIPQNMKIVNLAKRVMKKKQNRNELLKHLRKKYNDESLQLPNKHYLKLENRLTQFVTCDNRHRIKQFLKDRTDYHIIMEDLMIAYDKTFNKEANYLLRRLQIQQLVNDIEKYCKQFGIKLSKVNPAYTSQMCHVCGYTSKKNRKSQETFSCQMCNNTCNADINAAINIMNRYFDKRIVLNTPNWRVKEILGVIDN